MKENDVTTQYFEVDVYSTIQLTEKNTTTTGNIKQSDIANK